MRLYTAPSHLVFDRCEDAFIENEVVGSPALEEMQNRFVDSFGFLRDIDESLSLIFELCVAKSVGV